MLMNAPAALRKCSAVTAGSGVRPGDITRPEPGSVHVTRQFARPGPLDMVSVQSPTTRPISARSTIEFGSGRINSSHVKHGRLMQVTAGSFGIAVYVQPVPAAAFVASPVVKQNSHAMNSLETYFSSATLAS